jgi:hypothetical protein
MKVRSYPKVYQLGHKAIETLFDGPVVIQEKVDGSQFSFGVIDGELSLRSKGKEIFPGTEDKLFKMAVDTAVRLYEEGALVEGWIYRGESITSPKHNHLKYDRIPTGGVILFDVDTGLENRVQSPERLRLIGDELGLEVVPTVFEGVVDSLESLKAYLEGESILGSVKPEGIVIKNYSMFGADGKMLMGKLVREDFRESNKKDFTARNPTTGTIVEFLIDELRSEVRWQKAIQHLREYGCISDSPKDIGPLLKEIQDDVLAEEEDYIKEQIFKVIKKDILRGVVRGFPEWYKQRLLDQQKFGGE